FHLVVRKVDRIKSHTGVWSDVEFVDACGGFEIILPERAEADSVAFVIIVQDIVGIEVECGHAFETKVLGHWSFHRYAYIAKKKSKGIDRHIGLRLQADSEKYEHQRGKYNFHTLECLSGVIKSMKATKILP